MAASYRIVDEPLPSRLSRLVVNPFWILLGLMLGGAWLGFPWFAFNAFAVGSAARRKEVALSVGGLVGALGIGFAVLQLATRGLIEHEWLPYAGTGLIVWKLGMGYTVHASQALSHELYQYFGGVSRKGLFLVIGGLLLRPYLVEVVFKDNFWLLVLM